MLNYSALPIAKPTKSPLSDVLAILILFIVIFGGIVVIFSAEEMMKFVGPYGGYAAGVIALALIGLYINVFRLAYQKMLQQRQMLSDFARDNDWVYELVENRASLPVGLPKSAYVQYKKFSNWFSTPPAMVVSDTTGTSQWKLIYVREDGPELLQAFNGTIVQRWPIYYTYVGRKDNAGVWSFTKQKGFILDQVGMKSIIEQ